jgi:acyl carrier protein
MEPDRNMTDPTATSDAAAARVEPFLIGAIARFTRQPVEAIASDSVLVDLGLQSIDAVLLSGEVEDHFGIELDPSTVFEHDTLDSFAREIARRLDAA